MAKTISNNGINLIKKYEVCRLSLKEYNNKSSERASRTLSKSQF